MKYSLLFNLDTFHFFPVAFFCVYFLTCENIKNAPSTVNLLKFNLEVTDKLASEYKEKLNPG
jgi:hypothetical protein